MVMSRRRELPPEILFDERLTMPDPVFRTAIGLRADADNWGRGSANPALVKAAFWALRHDITVDDVFDHLVLLRDLGYIQLYEDGERWVYQMADWPPVSHKSDDRCRFPGPPSGERPETFPAGEEEGEREGREDEGLSGTLPGYPPSRYCPKHRPHGTFNRCGPCATARERHERWQDEQLDQANGEFREDR
ncbi:MAG: hypothetical protein JWP85_2103 [Rhodoglobus sp.]|nr:hypothetical protein [Rhodoglobus sp.]